MKNEYEPREITTSAKGLCIRGAYANAITFCVMTSFAVLQRDISLVVKSVTRDYLRDSIELRNNVKALAL